MVKKVLFTYGHARDSRSWGMFGEILSRLLNNSDYEVYWLRCNKKFAGRCWYSTHSHLGYCKKCVDKCSEIADLIGLDKDHIIDIRNYKVQKFPVFKTIDELIHFDIDGYNLGLSSASTIMTITRDYKFNLKKYKNHVNKILEEEFIILENVKALFTKYKFDEIHVFTGRTPVTYPFISYAQKNKIPFVVYEAGAKSNKLRIDKNTTPHDFYNLKNCIRKAWDTAGKDRELIAQKWFDERRAGKFQAIESFTKDQIKNLLPSNWDESKENIAFFNSSIDEIYAFDSWKQPFFDTDTDVINAILEHYKNDTSKHFYLRVHPNLTNAKKNQTTQIKEIENLKRKYKNLTVIEPDDKIDSYALVDAASKVVTCGSSVGCEATYWGNISILFGKTQYENDGCTYNANSFEELYELLDRKDLLPKPKETTYPYGYYNEIFGEDYKYFNNNGELLK